MKSVSFEWNVEIVRHATTLVDSSASTNNR